MPQGTCTINDADCRGDHYAQGYCRIHYGRWRRHGDPLRADRSGVPAGPVKLCSVKGCPGTVNSHGLCGKHDQRRRRGMDLEAPSSVIADMEERFFSHVRKEASGCWTWTAALFRSGYGEFGNGAGKVVGAHRWSYEHFVGPIPDGLEIDHLCHTRERLSCPGGLSCPHRRCVNPAHLEPVTHAENSRRAVSQAVVSDEVIAILHARWRAGERVVVLAAEAGVRPGALYKRFERIAA